MDLQITRARQGLHGTVRVPPDKAIAHRAVFLSAMAEGDTEIRPWPAAEDCRRTLEIVQRLGVAASRSAEGVRIHGAGRSGLCAPEGELWCGESGTTLRLAAGLLAGQPFRSRLTAAPSLSRRPMQRIVEPLTRMGARIEGAPSVSGSPPETYPPLAISGMRPLRAIRYAPPVASAQVKSAVLLAGLFADGPTRVIERWPTRDHTERMLQAFRVRVQTEDGCVTVEPGVPVSPGSLVLPGDFSSAAFLLAAAACVPGSQVTLDAVSLNPSRSALLGVLARMGGVIAHIGQEEQAWEPRGTLAVKAHPLRAVTMEPHEAPGLIDELPVLMVAAACAQGRSTLRGVGELRVKETDRVRSMVDGLRRLGARVELPDAETIEIEGGPLTGGVVESAGDHRTAMSLAVAGLLAEGTTTVRGAECIAKSFPEFIGMLRALAGSTAVQAPHGS